MSTRAAVCLMGCLAFSAGADSIEPVAPLNLDWKDAGWLGAAALAQTGAQLRFNAMDPVDTAFLDRGDLPTWERWAAGRYSPEASIASDVLTVSLCALPLAWSAWDARRARQGWSPVITDAVILGEAFALSSSLNLFARSLRIHPRPFVYGHNAPESKRLAGEASGSFYSGHASAAFAGAVYLAYTHGLKHPDSEIQGWLWAGGLGLATTVAVLRVEAGKHFPSDVIAGAAMGSLFGWLLPRLHQSQCAHGTASHLRLEPNLLSQGATVAWTF